MPQALQGTSATRDQHGHTESGRGADSKVQSVESRTFQLTFQQYQMLLEVSESIALHRDLQALFHDLAQRLPCMVPFDYINADPGQPDSQV